MPLPHDPGPHWGEVGIHGLHRQREWDVVTTVAAPELSGDERWFVVLEGDRIVVEEGSGDVEPLVAAVAQPPPFRARAVRQESLWVVAARRIETVELTRDPGGESLELVWDGVERSLRVDGEPTLSGVPELERLGAARGSAYVVTASRLVDDVWEVAVAQL